MTSHTNVRSANRSVFEKMLFDEHDGALYHRIMKFKIKKNAHDQYYWVLVARNGEPICTSDPYESRESTVKSINLVKLDAHGAEIVDTTTIFRKPAHF